MRLKRWLGMILIATGIILFFINPILNLTGYAIDEKLIVREVWFYVVGLGLIFLGIILVQSRIPVPAGLEDIVAEVGPFTKIPYVFVDTSTIVSIREAIKESGADPSKVDFLGAAASGSYQYFVPEHGLREMRGLSTPTPRRGYSPHGRQTIEREAFYYLSSFLPRIQRKPGNVTVELKKNPNLHFVEDKKLANYEAKVKTAIGDYAADSRTTRKISPEEQQKFLKGADAKLIAGAIMAREYGSPAVVLTEDSLVREVVNYLNRTRKKGESEIRAYGVGDWQRKRHYSLVE